MQVEETPKKDTPQGTQSAQETSAMKEQAQEGKEKEPDLLEQLNDEISRMSTEQLISYTSELGFETRTHRSNAKLLLSKIKEKKSILKANETRLKRGKQLPFLVGNIVEVYQRA